MFVRGRGRGRNFVRKESSNDSKGVKALNTPPRYTSGSSNRNISRHDNKCCDGIGFSLSLNDEGLEFFEKLKNLWNMLKKSPPVVSLLYNHYNTCENPYEQSLRLLYNCQEFYSAKSKSLPFFIMEEFKNWSVSNRDRIVHLLTPELKIDAFKLIGKQNSLQLTRLVVEAFEMIRDSEIFIDIVRCMIDRKLYKEACQSAVLFSLQDKFTLDEIVLPLILQDKLVNMDEYLLAVPQLQIELVTFLDRMLGQPSIREAIVNYTANMNIPNIKWEKIYPKPWKKLIARMLKMYKLSQDLTPNLNRRRNEGALQFLLHKRFIENSFSDESWKEMVQEAVGDDPELHKELVTQVSWHGDFAEALRWAHFYNVNREFWPNNVKMLEDDRVPHDSTSVSSPEVASTWDDEPVPAPLVEYHKYPLNYSTIHLVDNESAFEKFLDTGLQNVDLVGIDCEWKPSFGGQKNELALMQLATRKNVFILDIVNLGTIVPHLWQELGKFLFNNCDILKLGFALTSDISMIKNALPELNFSHKLGFLDLLTVWKHIDKFPNMALPFEVQTGGPSLSTLVQHCLGHPLDKSDQFSNWEKRPLRHTQLLYAALDAYCLIQVYDVIRNCCEKNNIPFDEICYNIMTNEKMAKKKVKKPIRKNESTKVEQNIPQPESFIKEPIPASDVRFVCDTMLQGLGKNLRRCGIDTVLLENHHEHMECARFAEDENRFILTRGTIFNKLYGTVPQGCCYKVVDDDVDQQLKEVLDYYKIIVKKDNVFSRCQACNGNSFVKISKSTMSILLDASNRPYRPPPPCYVEEATGFSSEEELFEDEPGPPINSKWDQPGPPTNSRKWELYSDEKIDVGLCQTRLGATIQVKLVPPGIVEKNDMFYICEECGKVYWDGSHFSRVISGRLQDVVQ